MAPRQSGQLPVPNPTPSFWNTEKNGKFSNFRSTPNLPSEADIVIVGSGFSGVATGYFLLKDNLEHCSVVLLEARHVCSGATGRNGGHLKPESYSNMHKLVSMLGVEAAADIAEFEAANVYALKDLVEREAIDCDFHLTRALDVYLDHAHAQEMAATYKKFAASRMLNLKDVALTSEKDAERVYSFLNPNDT